MELLTGVAEVLAAAHEAHILHRDIKPGNILVSHERVRKACRLWSCQARKAMQRHTDETCTQSGAQICGNSGLHVPGAGHGARPCDARSDIFSLGIVLYESVRARPPKGPPTWKCCWR